MPNDGAVAYFAEPALASAITIPAAAATPSASTSERTEALIGHLVATVASLVAQGLGELRQTGQMSAYTRSRGGELVAALIDLRESTAGKLDFDYVARVHGVQTLTRHCGELGAARIDWLVGAAIDIMGNIVQQQSS